jgi:predicted alpha/beta-fold hydrolase
MTWSMRRALPIQECRTNPHTVLAVTDTGGHCGHLQGLWPLGRSFLDDTAVRFCRAMLSSRLELQTEEHRK